MIDWLGWLTQGSAVDLRRALVALLLAFGLGQVVALVYMATFRGLSYARSAVHSMAMGSVITCMLMLAVGSSLAAGIGVAVGLSAVRFRTTLRDPRDVMFIFAALGVGIACGLQAFGAALAGTAIFGGGTLLLHVTGYGARRQPDGLLRFTAPSMPDAEEALAKILRAHCQTFSLVTLREAAQGTLMEHAYQISVRAPELRASLVSRLQAIPGVQDVSLMLQEPTLDL
ncbi:MULTISPECIES: DUF4956 domain-containing protein [Sorangium]|uniref:DUF4956 domain-containing protein n=1 Tax=Sorangium cellulosum TaxID=56 RepID=A0A4P2R2C0_SORCE|nr:MULTISPECIES: DUF4956 domain-containing protein [Sorangium]AUX37110.1 hypothetical protein SOCE836_093310 [Sorangium cellulosum]WCQ96401.1 hypothetical protein NQZ70_09187 [Sorangium sp. Soce836]